MARRKFFLAPIAHAFAVGAAIAAIAPSAAAHDASQIRSDAQKRLEAQADAWNSR